MFGFIVSVLVTVGAVVLAVVLVVVRREETKRDPIEGMGLWEVVNGKAWRAMEDQNNLMDTTQKWVNSLVVFAIASAIFAVIKGVMLWGG